nr:transglutaminase domain-containing protein [uncultured Oscillibacter sp.]
MRKHWKKALLGFLAALMLLTVSAAAEETEGAAGMTGEPETAAADILPTEPADEAGELIWVEAVETIGIERGGEPEVSLSAAENFAAAAEQLAAGLRAFQTEISISESCGIVNTNANIQKLVDMACHNNPDLFMVQSGETWGIGYTNGGILVSLTPPAYTMTPAEYKPKKEFYDREIERIAGLVDPEWSDLEQVLFIHDYLAANYEYDTSYTIHDAYNFLSQKTGVCESYTRVFIALMQKLGIPVSYVESSNKNHIWNLVQIGGHWYHVDVTFDDPVNDRLGCARHMYFLRSDGGLEGHDVEGEERDWVYGVSESCTDTTYDSYFWGKANTPFLEVDGTWYFIESDSYLSDDGKSTVVTASRLMRWDEGDGTDNQVLKSGFTTGGSGLGYFAGKLYYNTFFDLCSYDLKTGETKTLFTDASIYITGSRLESGEDGTVLQYQQDSIIYELTIDPYKPVAGGGYGYYQEADTVYLRLVGTNMIAVAWYQNGKMLGAALYTGAGEYSSTSKPGATEARIIAVEGTEQWGPICEALSLVA